MEWTSLSHFLLMDGHGPYVWAVYGMWVLLILIEIFGPPLQGRAAPHPRSPRPAQHPRTLIF